jgi:hypothetical protein
MAIVPELREMAIGSPESADWAAARPAGLTSVDIASTTARRMLTLTSRSRPSLR